MQGPARAAWSRGMLCGELVPSAVSVLVEGSHTLCFTDWLLHMPSQCVGEIRTNPTHITTVHQPHAVNLGCFPGMGFYPLHRGEM